MKQITIKNNGPKLTVGKIRTFEKQLGVELPSDYRNFL